MKVITKHIKATVFLTLKEMGEDDVDTLIANRLGVSKKYLVIKDQRNRTTGTYFKIEWEKP